MKKVTWLGRSDARHLSPDDLKKAGVEISKDQVFPRLEAVSVSNELAKALTENARLFGNFAIVDDEVEEGEQLDFSKLEEAPEAQTSADSGSSTGSEATTTASSTQTTAPAATSGSASTAGNGRRNAKANQ